MTLELINPEDLPTPPTYTPVVIASGSRLVLSPADTLVGVEALSHPDYQLEVEAVAIIDD